MAIILTCLSILYATNAFAGPSGLVSDGFNTGTLGPRWTFYDPVGNSTLSMTGTQAAISVPAGSNHDLWKNALFAPRIRQAANNTDFTLEAKFDSLLTTKAQLHGFTVEQNATNFIDFLFYTDGTATRIFSASFVNGSPTIRINSVITNGAPLYLRVTRVGNLWTTAYSYNGNNWTSAGSYTYSLPVASVGIFGGNAPNDSPAYTALVDYFMADGVAPDDGGADVIPPVISNVQASSVTSTSATITWTTNEPSSSLVNFGLTSTYGTNSSNAALVTPHSLTLTGLTPNTLYHYRVNSTDASNNSASSGDLILTTLSTAPNNTVNWLQLSSRTGDLPVPPTSNGQIALKVADLNKDGLPDYLMSMWQNLNSFKPTLVWYQQQPNGSFVMYLIDNELPNISHSEGLNDIDGDGDLDIIIGQASKGSTIDWWENPYPNYIPNIPWVRRGVYSGAQNYHDGIWGDFDNDGKDEYISWNQKARQLLLFEKPVNPKTSGLWPVTQIFKWSGDDYLYRGIDAIDINLDGKIDLVGSCAWFEHTGGTNFIRHPIDEAMAYSQIQAGQLITGGRPEVVCLKEGATGPLNMYEWNGSAWQTKTLVSNIPSGHTLQIGDVNSDGNNDIMFAELANSVPANPNAGLFVLYGDGFGNFSLQTVNLGQESLEGQLADIDNDGDLDIVTKPFTQNKPIMEMYINMGNHSN